MKLSVPRAAECPVLAVQALAVRLRNVLCSHPHRLDPGFLKRVVVPQAPVTVVFTQVITRG